MAGIFFQAGQLLREATDLLAGAQIDVERAAVPSNTQARILTKRAS